MRDEDWPFSPLKIGSKRRVLTNKRVRLDAMAECQVIR